MWVVSSKLRPLYPAAMTSVPVDNSRSGRCRMGKHFCLSRYANPEYLMMQNESHRIGWAVEDPTHKRLRIPVVFIYLFVCMFVCLFVCMSLRKLCLSVSLKRKGYYVSLSSTSTRISLFIVLFMPLFPSVLRSNRELIYTLILHT